MIVGINALDKRFGLVWKQWNKYCQCYHEEDEECPENKLLEGLILDGETDDETELPEDE